MRYFYLNSEDQYADKPVLAKLSKKAEDICNKMSKLSRQHAMLDRELVEELARINNVTEQEISDMMSEYDWLVDVSQYGLGNVEQVEQITKEEFLKLKEE